MIPAALEKLILSGKAVYQTFVAGGAGTSILPVGKNSFIVIIDITSFHWGNAGPTFDLAQLNQESVYQMSLNSGKSQNHFIFKGDVTASNTNPPLESLYFLNGHTKLEVYLIHKEDVKIDFLRAPFHPWSTTSGETPPKVSQFPPPIGYGSGDKGIINTILNLNFTAGFGGGSTSPIGSKFTPAGQDPAFNGIQFPSSLETRYLDNFGGVLPTNNEARSFPLANIGYVKILEPIPDTVLSSS